MLKELLAGDLETPSGETIRRLIEILEEPPSDLNQVPCDDRRLIAFLLGIEYPSTIFWPSKPHFLTDEITNFLRQNFPEAIIAFVPSADEVKLQFSSETQLSEARSKLQSPHWSAPLRIDQIRLEVRPASPLIHDSPCIERLSLKKETLVSISSLKTHDY